MPSFDEVNTAIQNLRHALQADGGDIELVSVSDDGKVKVKLQGACGSCPMATMTLKQFVEARLKQSVAGVSEVVQA